MNYWITLDWGPGVEGKPTETFVTVSDSETNVEAAVQASLQEQFGMLPASFKVGGSSLAGGGFFAAEPDNPNESPF